MKKNNNSQNKVIEAAGGVIYTETSSGIKVAIIYRKEYDDWSLPKGKRDPGESWQETALREAREETGCPVKLKEFIGSTAYPVRAGPKVVLFWLMKTKNKKGCKLEPNKEVEMVKWISPGRALKLLDYKDERAIVRKAMQQLQNR